MTSEFSNLIFNVKCHPALGTNTFTGKVKLVDYAATIAQVVHPNALCYVVGMKYFKHQQF